MEGGANNFAEYTYIMDAVDNAIQESYYRMCSEKMMSDFQKNSASNGKPDPNKINSCTPGASKGSKNHDTVLSTEDQQNGHDELEPCPGKTNKAIHESDFYRMFSKKMMSKFKEKTPSCGQPDPNSINTHSHGGPKSSKNHVTFPLTSKQLNGHDEFEHQPGCTNDASIEDSINRDTGKTNDENVFVQNTMNTIITIEKKEICPENIFKDNHNCQVENPTLINNADTAVEDKTEIDSEDIGESESPTSPVCIIKTESDTKETTENEHLKNTNHDTDIPGEYLKNTNHDTDIPGEYLKNTNHDTDIPGEYLKNTNHDTDIPGGTEKKMNCRDCGTTFPNAYQLSLHKRTVPECASSNITPTYQCQICERLFSSSSRLRKHLRTHLGTKPYKCNICQKQFTQSHNLKRHILIHTGEQPFQCSICKHNFTCAANAKRHIRAKHVTEVEAAPDPEVFIESLVKRTTPTSISLKDESLATILDIPAEESEEIIMPKRRKFGTGNVCQICDRKFTRSSHLRDHMHSHTGQRPYQCHLCEYNTNFKSGLNKHLRIHTGIKPHACAFCPRTFYGPSERDTHQVQIHSEEKDFICGLCNAQFARPYLLKRHVENSHIGLYEHTCGGCQKHFKNAAVLRRHKQKYCPATKEATTVNTESLEEA